MPLSSSVAQMALASAVAAGAIRTATPFDGGTVAFTGSVHGTIPPAACVAAEASGLPIRSFEEIPAAGERYRAFRIRVTSSCVAPLFQALFSRETVQARIAMRSGTPDAAGAIVDARLTRVELATAANERGTKFPIVTVELTSSRVTGVASAHSHTTAYSDASLVPRGHAESWVRAGVVGTSVRIAGAASGQDVSFASGEQRIAASWSVDETTGLPRGELHIAVDPLDKAAGSDDGALAGAVQSRRELSEAVISFLGRDGTAGIVVWLKRASLAGFIAPARTPNGVRGVGRVSLVAHQLTITDIGSGRTAAFP